MNTRPANDPTAALAVEVTELRFGYGSNSDVLDLARLRISAAERVFMYGPSGSGKSTLLALVGGVLVPRAGRLAVLGQDIGGIRSAARDRFRADHVGFIFQQFNLVPYLSVAENVTLPCRYSARRLQRTRDSDGSAAEAAARLLDTLGINQQLRARKPTDLSVGQQQRIAVARALIGRPELIVADEPTSALDTARRREFIELLLTECSQSQSTVLFVSHDVSLANYFDRNVDLELENNVAQVIADG